MSRQQRIESRPAVTVGAFLLEAEGGNASIEGLALLIAVLPFTVIPAACAKIMAEYYAYIAIVLGSPFM